MSALILFCLATIGMTLIVVDSDLMAILKNRVFENTEKDKTGTFSSWMYLLLSCTQCSGFWCGVIMGILLNPLQGLTNDWLLYFAYGCAGSYLSPLGAFIAEFFNTYSQYSQNRR